MTLTATLDKAKTEEDVKDAYIKALGLKSYNKGLVDIQTEEIWFEAKEAATPPVLMFTQLLFYVRDARKNGEPIPPFLAVIDREKAAIMETAKALPILLDKDIKWPKSASAVDKNIAAQAAPYIETHFVVYKMASHETEFVQAVKTAIKAGKLIRTPITPDNLRQVFDQWVKMIGRELDGVSETDYVLLFFADIMHDGKKAAMSNLPARLLHEDDKPLFLLNDTTFELSSDRGYRNFWAIYHRPPEEEHRAYLLERRDSLLPLDERSFKGAYYTPLHVVDKAYDLLAQTLGKNWQQNYIVWDMCCGVGNLEVKHSNHRNIFMSTLDKADIDLMAAARTCVAATKFQYDYLNDDIPDWCTVDYDMTNKMPQELRKAIADSNSGVKGAKKILILMNPPYAESGSGIGEGNKAGVAKTMAGYCMMSNYGNASNELFAQFLARIQIEMPNAMIAIFSTLKYVNSTNFEQFREMWRAKYLDGFVVHNKAFDGMKGSFPIGFLIWDTSKKIVLKEVNLVALDKEANNTGSKTFYSLPANTYLNVWIVRPRANKVEVLPLKNAVTPTSSKPRVENWSNDAVAYMYCGVNDIQHAVMQTVLMSSVYHGGNGFYITAENLWQAAIIFSVRRLIKPTWLNDRDQFLQPTEKLSEAFKTDCLIWMLFSGSNLTASANDLDWNNKKWSIVNHFIPFTETEVGAAGRFESNFMVKYLEDKKLSKEAQAVLNEGRSLWQAYHATQFERKICDEYKLNRPDVGWYQIRKSLEANEENEATNFAPFKTAFEALTLKLRPMVYELGFLRE